MNRTDFPFTEAGAIAAELIECVYTSVRFHPDIQPTIVPLAEQPSGFEGFVETLRHVVMGSASLSSPMMLGHMDTSPHPAAAYADAVVSALNNNLLFRELSPYASRVEEYLLDDFAQRAGLTSPWCGTFTSGGSIANLTALFAAVGGFSQPELRNECAFFIPECAHNSIMKSLAVLGVASSAIHVVAGDAVGRSNLESLQELLNRNSAQRKIVISVLGSTVHGAVENLAAVATISKQAGAWLHVDAIYGAALIFSRRYRALLMQLDSADSVVMGPQKWMFVPRLCAMVYIKDEDRFNDALRYTNTYSSTDMQHRGQWGLQGSRRADALTLWVLLQTIGTACITEAIDQSIELTREFHKLLLAHATLKPLHEPDLNLQCFGYKHASGNYHHKQASRIEAMLGRNGVPWVSQSSWDGEPMFRAVLLAPEATTDHLQALLGLSWDESE